jgi:hypothetical protein
MTSPTALPSYWTPKVQVDWSGDGTYTGPADDVTRDTAADPGLTLDTGRDGARSLNPPKVPSLELELRNDHVRYSNENPLSPVYQLVTPGTPVLASFTFGKVDRYTAHTPYTEHDPYDGLAHINFGSFRLDQVSQAVEWGQQRVKVRALGLSSTLVGRSVSVDLHQALRTDQAIALVLDAAGWPTDKRALSPGDTTLLFWWADERSAWDLLVELLAAEGPGAMYEDENGVFHFENRNYRAVTPRSQTSQASFSDIGSYSTRDKYTAHNPYTAHDNYDGHGTGLYFVDLQYSPGWDNLYARATYATKRRQSQNPTVVWQYGAPLTLAANEARTLIVRPNDPFTNAITPVATTDYVVASGSVAVSMTATSGFVAFVTFTAGASGATLNGPAASPSTGPQLRAQPLPVLSETVAQSSISTTSSNTTYRGIQTLSIAGWPEIDPAAAAAVCDAWVSRYNVQRPQVTLTIRAGDVRHFEQIVERRVSDRITIVERNTGLATDLWIESKHVTMSGAGGRQLVAVWGCEVCDALVGDVWDGSTALWDSARWGR